MTSARARGGTARALSSDTRSRRPPPVMARHAEIVTYPGSSPPHRTRAPRGTQRRPPSPSRRSRPAMPNQWAWLARGHQGQVAGCARRPCTQLQHLGVLVARQPGHQPGRVNHAGFSWAHRVSGCSCPSIPVKRPMRSAHRVRAWAGSPASPTQRAYWLRVRSTSACAGPNTRSRHGQELGGRCRGREPDHRPAGPQGEVEPDRQGDAVLRSRHPPDVVKQRDGQVPRPDRIAALAHPVRVLRAGGQRERVVGPADLLRLGGRAAKRGGHHVPMTPGRHQSVARCRRRGRCPAGSSHGLARTASAPWT